MKSRDEKSNRRGLARNDVMWCLFILIAFVGLGAPMFLTFAQPSPSEEASEPSEEASEPSRPELKYVERTGTDAGKWKKLSTGHYITSLRTATLSYSFDTGVTWTSWDLLERGGGREQSSHPVTANQGELTRTLEAGTTEFTLSGEHTPLEGNQTAESNTITVKRHDKGPVVDKIGISSRFDGRTQISIFFRTDIGIDRESLTETNTIITPKGDASKKLGWAHSEHTGNAVWLLMNEPLPPGNYTIKLKGTDTDPITDTLKTPLMSTNGAEGPGDDYSKDLVHYQDDAEPAPHVAYPPVVPPTDHEYEEWNPGDTVTTRVARLYYYRDAHRVAQIINRNVKSYNHVAVTQAERRSEESRLRTEEFRRERLRKHNEAYFAAQRLREARHELDRLNSDLERTNAELDRLNDDEEEEEEEEEEGDDDDDETTALNDEKTRLNNEKTRLRAEIAEKRDEVDWLRDHERHLRTEFEQAQAKEDFAVEEQFRYELAAAKTDPDTYAPGIIDSVDPVTQVSVSVIGEGQIFLRGPIKGINKIRRIINQIDAPVGQVKVGIDTLQVNGEGGDKMEDVVAQIEANVGLGRFLTNRSLDILRNCIQREAMQAAMCPEPRGALAAGSPGARTVNAMQAVGQSQQTPVAAASINQAYGLHGGDAKPCCDCNGHGCKACCRVLSRLSDQDQRDIRYLYNFFGADFVRELDEMNSGFLKSGNKILSLHSMDTMSLHRALFILALAKNDVRHRILSDFHYRIQRELPEYEQKYRQSSGLSACYEHKKKPSFWQWANHADKPKNQPCDDACSECRVLHDAGRRYHFSNFLGMFRSPDWQNPNAMNPVQREFIRLSQILQSQMVAEMELKEQVVERGLIQGRRASDEKEVEEMIADNRRAMKDRIDKYLTRIDRLEDSLISALEGALSGQKRRSQRFAEFASDVAGSTSGESGEIASDEADDLRSEWEVLRVETDEHGDVSARIDRILQPQRTIATADAAELRQNTESLARDAMLELEKARKRIYSISDRFFRTAALFVSRPASQRVDMWPVLSSDYQQLRGVLESNREDDLKKILDAARNELRQVYVISIAHLEAEKQFHESRTPLDHRKLIDHMIDEQEEKLIELKEGTRAHISVIDQYLKRTAVALEDDFRVQFYDPAFERIRKASRACEVTLGKIERTTVLTNNRMLAKVLPQATMEFDLPKREIAIAEAMQAAKALSEDVGALMNDPAYLAAFQMMGGAKMPGQVQGVLPTLPTSTDMQSMGLAPRGDGQPVSSLQQLVPDPAIYKFETGTGFEIRPVIQPDGDSVVYDFNYMYTTDVWEPVASDEKHLGRVKRHFLHTQVQTSSFELREVSRYQVALKAARTGNGVPLLEDIPVVGAAFRPAPSDSSSIQQNIILAESVVYPTLFDLMGLRWAPHVAELTPDSLNTQAATVRGRANQIRQRVQEYAKQQVNDYLDIHECMPCGCCPIGFCGECPKAECSDAAAFAEPLERSQHIRGGNSLSQRHAPQVHRNSTSWEAALEGGSSTSLEAVERPAPSGLTSQQLDAFREGIKKAAQSKSVFSNDGPSSAPMPNITQAVPTSLPSPNGVPLNPGEQPALHFSMPVAP